MLNKKIFMTDQLKKIVFAFSDEERDPFLSLFLFRMDEAPVKVIHIGADKRAEYVDDLSFIDATLWITDDKIYGAKLQKKQKLVLLYDNPLRKQTNALIVDNKAEHGYFPYVIEGFEDVDYCYLDRIYRRLKKIPWDILETDRLYVRETMLEDLPAFYEIYQDPSICQYTEKLFDDSKEEAEYLKAYIDTAYRFYETGIYTVILKETGEIIGRAGLDRRVEFEELELGFLIAKKHQKKGYAKEVCQALLQYANEYFPEDAVHAFVEPENEISIHLLEKLGFYRKGKQIVTGVKGDTKEYIEYGREE